MLKKLTEADHQSLIQYLSIDSEMNLFIISDLESFGYQSDFQDIWADLDEDREIRSVLLRYYHTYIPYARGDFDVAPYVEIIMKDDRFELLQGKADVTEKFEVIPSLRHAQKRTAFYAKLSALTKADAHSGTLSQVKRATLDDVDRIFELRCQIATFIPSKSSRHSLWKSMEKGISRTFYVEDEKGQMISAASTAAENSMSAMIVGVCTLPEHRRKGLASLCMTVLCQELVNEKRTPCLFYDNPSAGKIYKRLGFHDFGLWNMYRVM
jgi:predicted GNAT family acetyltransferase